MAPRSAVIHVDTNVIIDILQRDPVWFEWSATQLSTAGAEGPMAVSAIVVAELSRDFATPDELNARLAILSLDPLPLDEESAFTGGRRFQAYRRGRADPQGRARMLPDFLIGAQALVPGVPLLTRDARLYRRFFPDLALITPETDHG